MSLYAKENMILLNIYIRDPYVKKYKTEEKVTIVRFVGTIGGLLGLFLGFSFVSIVEILYIFTFGRPRGLKPEGSKAVQVKPADSGLFKSPVLK